MFFDIEKIPIEINILSFRFLILSLLKISEIILFFLGFLSNLRLSWFGLLLLLLRNSKQKLLDYFFQFFKSDVIKFYLAYRLHNSRVCQYSKNTSVLMFL